MWLYKLVEELPKFMTPHRPSRRAIVLRQGDRIIGAWLDAGPSGWGCSLQGQPWETVTGRPFEAWVADLLQRDDPEVTRLAGLTPEEVVRAYYAAVDSHGAASSRLYRSIKSLRQDMFRKMDNSLRQMSEGYCRSQRDQQATGIRHRCRAWCASVYVPHELSA